MGRPNERRPVPTEMPRPKSVRPASLRHLGEAEPSAGFERGYRKSASVTLQAVRASQLAPSTEITGGIGRNWFGQVNDQKQYEDHVSDMHVRRCPQARAVQQATRRQ